MAVSPASIQNFLNKLNQLNDSTIDSVNQLFESHYLQANLNDADYRIRKCHILLQLNLAVIDAMNIPEQAGEFAVLMVNEIKSSIAANLVNLEAQPTQAQQRLQEYVSVNPLQTIAALFDNAPNLEQATAMRQLMLLMQLQPQSMIPELDRHHDLYQQYLTNWQQFSAQLSVATTTTVEVEAENMEAAPAVAASSSEMQHFGFDEEGNHVVYFAGEAIENRAVNNARKFIDEQTELNQLALSYINRQQNQIEWQNMEVTVDKDNDYPDNETFECPIHFIVMDGTVQEDRESTPYVYEDGRSYSLQNVAASYFGRYNFSQAPLLNQPLLDAEKQYHQLLITWRKLCKAYPDMPQTKAALEKAVAAFVDTESPADSVQASAPSESEFAAASSSTPSSSNSDMFIPKGKGRAQRGKQRADAKVIDSYFKQLALRHCIRTKVRSGELDASNSQVQNTLGSCLFILDTINNHYSGLPDANNERISNIVEQMLALPAQRLAHYNELKQTEREQYSLQAEMDESSVYSRAMADRRAMDASYPLIREWAKLEPCLLQAGQKQQAKANLTIEQIPAKRQQAQAASSASSSITPEYDNLYKMIVLGAKGAGKSNLLLRFASNQFIATQGLVIRNDYTVRTLTINEHRIKIQAWDMPKADNLNRHRGTAAYLIACDVSDSQALINAKQCLDKLRQFWSDKVTVVLVGTKADLTEQRQVSHEDLIKFADEHQIAYVETSSQSGHGIEQAFSQGAMQVLAKNPQLQRIAKSKSTESQVASSSSRFSSFVRSNRVEVSQSIEQTAEEPKAIHPMAQANLSLTDIDAKRPGSQIANSSRRIGYDLLNKVKIIGDTGVGKSCLLLRFCDNHFTESFISTIGVDFKIKTLDVKGFKTKMQVWDTTNRERLRGVPARPYAACQGAHAIVIAFDVTDETTFNNVRKWHEVVRQFSVDEPSIILVATKVDLSKQRRVSHEQAVNLADELGMAYVETSAKDGLGVEEAFMQVALQIHAKHPPKQVEQVQQQEQAAASSNGLFAGAGKFFGKAAYNISGGFKR